MKIFPIFPFILLAMTGCGASVPVVEEFNERIYGTKALERKVKEKIFCELQQAVFVLNRNPAARIANKTPIPQSWGVIVTISFMVIEGSSLGPRLSLTSPAPSQIFTLGISGRASAEATRTDKYTFFYPVTSLQEETSYCTLMDDQHPDGRAPLDFQGNSLLLTSHLGIYDWIKTAIEIRDTIGLSARSKQEVMSYNVKFDIVTSGSVTPSWSLERIKTGTDDFFTAKRERTHELLLTFGPVADNITKLGKEAPQPSSIVLFDQLASQVNSGFQSALRNNSPRF